MAIAKAWFCLEYTSDIFYSLEFLGVPIFVSNVYLKKNNIYFIMIFPPILNSYYPMKCSIFVIKKKKRSQVLTMQTNFHCRL